MQQVYYGWWIVGVLIVTAAIVSGTSFYCFGATAIGSILGFASLIFAIGPAIGPLYAAYIFDATSSYRITFLVYITIYVAAILLIIAAKKTNPEIPPIVRFSDSDLYRTN